MTVLPKLRYLLEKNLTVKAPLSVDKSLGQRTAKGGGGVGGGSD